MAQTITPKKVEYTQKVITKMTCDLCGKEAVNPESSFNPFGTNQYHNVGQATIELRIGVFYPEGNSGETLSFDICPDCFKKKLVPFVEKEGNSSVSIKEWE